MNNQDPRPPGKGRYFKENSEEHTIIANHSTKWIKEILETHKISGHKRQELEQELCRRRKISKKAKINNKKNRKKKQEFFPRGVFRDQKVTIDMLKDEIRGLNEENDALNSILDQVRDLAKEVSVSKRDPRVDKIVELSSKLDI